MLRSYQINRQALSFLHQDIISLWKKREKKNILPDLDIIISDLSMHLLITTFRV